MLRLSRRTVVKALGASAFLLSSPAIAHSAISPPLRSLEAIIGPARLERAKYLWSLPEWPHFALGGLVDDANELRMPSAFRGALSGIMHGCDAAIFTEDGEDREQRIQCRNVLALFSYFDLLPPDLTMGIEFNSQNGSGYSWFAVGDAWREFGWEGPCRLVASDWQPDPIWMMTGKTHGDSPLRFKLLADKLGWEEIDVIAAMEQALEDKRLFPDN